MTAAGSRTSCIRIRIYVASSGKLGCLHGNSSCCLDNTLNNNNSNNGDNKCDSDSCYLTLALRQVVATTTDKRRQLVTKTNANCRARSLLLSDSATPLFRSAGFSYVLSCCCCSLCSLQTSAVVFVWYKFNIPCIYGNSKRRLSTTALLLRIIFVSIKLSKI